MNRGPMANDKRKILRVSAMSVGSVMPYLMATSGNPGAMMELANGETKVYIETWHKISPRGLVSQMGAN